METNLIRNDYKKNVGQYSMLKNNSKIKETLSPFVKKDSEPCIKNLNNKNYYIEETINKLKKVSDIFNRRMDFRVDAKTHRIVVKIIDTQTDKVIKEIPPEQLLRLAEKIQEMIGLLVDEER